MALAEYVISPELANWLDHFKERAEDSANLNELEATCVRMCSSAISSTVESAIIQLGCVIKNLEAEGRPHGNASIVHVVLGQLAYIQKRIADADFILSREYAYREECRLAAEKNDEE